MNISILVSLRHTKKSKRFQNFDLGVGYTIEVIEINISSPKQVDFRCGCLQHINSLFKTLKIQNSQGIQYMLDLLKIKCYSKLLNISFNQETKKQGFVPKCPQNFQDLHAGSTKKKGFAFGIQINEQYPIDYCI